MNWILNLIAPLLFNLLDQWFKAQKNKEEIQEGYYRFLELVDKSGHVKVSGHLRAEDALKAKQKELLEELEREKNDA